MINKDSIVCAALNGQSNNDFIALLLWALLGVLASLLIELLRNKDKIRKSGGFSPLYWFQNNIVRLLLSIICIIVGLNFGDKFGFEIKTMFGAFAIGLSTDKILEAIVSMKYTKKD